MTVMRRVFRAFACAAAGLAMAVGPCDVVYDQVCPECPDCILDADDLDNLNPFDDE